MGLAVLLFGQFESHPNQNWSPLRRAKLTQVQGKTKKAEDLKFVATREALN